MTGTTPSGLAARLEGVPRVEWQAVALDLVRTETANLIGCAADDVVPDRAYRDLGYNSLAGVELTRVLSLASGVELALTMLFDHPTPEAVARHLVEEVTGEPPEAAEAAVAVPRADAPAGAAPATDDDLIAIVGAGCRLPGGVTDPEALWDLLRDGTDAISPFPTDRGWDVDAVYHPDPEHPGTTYSRSGGFLDGATGFDAAFFGISPREATAMDPQQRQLLEVGWETLENAGIDPHSLRDTATGVFVGVAVQDYSMLARFGPEELAGFWGVGTATSVASGRLSYKLGLRGPAMTVDTACSSSLVTLHLAVQSLRRGECSLALAGGVAVFSTPGMFVEFSRQRVMSPDGRCRSYSASADGAGWAEGVGMVVCERLGDARRNGHRVLAVVRGSAINSDGASNGLTAPSGPAQEDVLRAALADAGLEASDLDAVEGHGTGTSIGDPIEIRALQAVHRDRTGEPLWLGSLKSNVGHTQAAAGVAGVIKMVQALRHDELPRSLFADDPTSGVRWDAAPVALLGQPRPWPRGDRPRRAGVSAFGISGTNAHVILEEPPAADETSTVDTPDASDLPGAGDTDDAPVAWVLSGRSPAALAEQARRVRDAVLADPDVPAAGVARTLNTGRAHLEYRAAVVGRDSRELAGGLAALDGGVRAASRPKVAFLFPGQGSQYPGMARELAEGSPVFAEHLERCAAALAPHVDFDVRAALHGDTEVDADRVDVVQPLLFAVFVALAQTWRAHGVQPDVVVGHSQGEIAAACVAGALSLEDAARVVALRSRALARVAGDGGMVSVALPVERVEALLGPDSPLSVAALNGPSTVVVSGPAEELDELLAICAVDGLWARRIPVDYASHSAEMDRIRDEVCTALAPVTPRRAAVRMHSTVTGRPVGDTELDAGYWFRNIRSTVRFEPVLAELLDTGHHVLVEVSPHPVLTVPVGQTVEVWRAATGDERPVAVTPTLVRDRDDRTTFLTHLAELHTHGVPVDWDAASGRTDVRPVELPGYPFHHTRYWVDAVHGPSTDLGAVGATAVEHPLLGAETVWPDGGLLYAGRISTSTHPWLADHAVGDVVLLSGTTFVELVLCAGQRAGAPAVEELTVEAPLVLADDESVVLQVTVGEPDPQGRRPVAVHSRPGSAEDGADPTAPTALPVRHASGTLVPDSGPTTAGPSPAADGAEIPVEQVYERLAEQGPVYGPSFRGLRRVRRAGSGLRVEVEQADDVDVSGFRVHPGLLDAAFHAAVSELPVQDGQAWLPFSWSGVRVLQPGARMLDAHLEVRSGETVRLLAVDASGAPVLTVDEVGVRPAPLAALQRARGARTLPLMRTDWVAVVPDAAVPSMPSVLPAGAGVAELDELARSGDVPDVVVLPCAPQPDGGLAAAARDIARELLEVVLFWVRDERVAHSRLVLLTERALALPGESPELRSAPLVGLVRSAMTEHPDRFGLLDVDGTAESEAALASAVALIAAGDGEPQLALRSGRALAPRLARLNGESRPRAFEPDPDGTVLVTGGAGGIGAEVAVRLVEQHGVRHLLLAGRRGADTPGADALRDRLTGLGAAVTFAVCDVTDRASVAGLLDGVPAAHPLTAVVHSAAVLDDGVLEAMTPQRMDRVLGPKVDAAMHLHELTAGADLAAFVLFSSVAGVFGGAGQANYAAGNTFLDALAAHRRAAGLPGTSVAWGLWSQASDLTSHLDRQDLARLAGSGLAPLGTEEGMRLFDAACTVAEPVVVAARLDPSGLRAQARSGVVHPMLRSLVPETPRPSGPSLAQRLADTPEEERPALVRTTVLAEIAAVLGAASPAAVNPSTAFTDLGLDSLGAVQVRNRLNAATGLRLPSVTVFDHPTPAALADHVLERLAGSVVAADPLEENLTRLGALLGSVEASDRDRVAARLRTLLDGLGRAPDPGVTAGTGGTGGADRFAGTDADELFALIDRELGDR